MSSLRFNLESDCHKWPINHYGDWERDLNGRYFIPEFLSGSDYCNSTLLEVSNVQAWRETFKDSEDDIWCHVTGGYGTFAIVIDSTKMTAEMTEFLDALASYPSIDDSRLSQLKCDAQDEAWNDWAYKDFIKALEKRFEYDLDFPNEKLIHTVFHETSDSIGEYWVNESADSMYINIDKIAKAVTKEAWKQIVAASVED